MKNPLSTTLGKVLLILGLVVIGIALVMWLLLGQPLLAFYTVLIALILVGLWFGINWAVALWTRRKQQTFDASMAAREGIEDRKREWAGWITELKKQGIDRYKLPMYLLVGEPQSGKSILLHNSDLHFPFGQNRLSGIGGTRGCDWWFTEEAVILDLAGRLFTHEGGKSDEAEWEAFLALLATYRPQNPANGILLVLPCDGLLQDTPEKVAAKSGRMQNALLALTNRLDARLPVYVVLTKADKIFGFAETFHRLSAEKRQEMLGWSRSVEKVETPFDAGEAREAFEAFVTRMRSVRADTLSTEVLPEGQAAVDRMFAFPDELAALQPNLTLYLQRVFSESTLVDRLFFRGFYLTSGLQSGAPIAKVCSEMLGAKGQADLRTLESIFTKQRAFFIKDLVRKRIFVESGLVRPTRRRIVRSRRNTVIGYGVGALIVLASIYLAVDYMFDDYSKSNAKIYAAAEEEAEQAANHEQPVPVLVQALRTVQEAIEAPEPAEEELYGALEERYNELYVRLFDQRFFPHVRGAAEHALALRVTEGVREPKDHTQFLDWLEDVELLLGPIEAKDEEKTARLIRLAAEDRSEHSSILNRETLTALFDSRRGYSASTFIHDPAKAPPSSGDLDKAEEAVMVWWDGVLLPGGSWQAPGDLSYVLACQGLRDSSTELKTGTPESLAQNGHVFDVCERYRKSYTILNDSSVYDEKAKQGLKEITKNSVEDELSELESRRAQFLAKVKRPGDAWDAAQKWEAAQRVRALVKVIIKPSGAIGRAFGIDTAVVPTPDDVSRFDTDLFNACARNALWRGVESPRDLPRTLEILVGSAKDRKNRAVFNALKGRTLGMNSAFRERFETWPKLADALEGTDSRSLTGCMQTLELLSETRPAIESIEWSNELKPWLAHVERLYDACASDFLKSVEAVERPQEIETLNWQLLKKMGALTRLKDASTTGFPSRAQATFNRYLASYEQSLLAGWKNAVEQGGFTPVAEELNAHLGELANNVATDGAYGAQHDQWLEIAGSFVDEHVSRAHAELVVRWSPGLATETDFAKRIAEIRQSYEGMPSRYEPDNDVARLPSSTALQAESPLERALPRLKGRLEEIREFARPTPSSSLKSDRLVTRVQDLVREYDRDPNRIHETEQVVKDLTELRELRSKPSGLQGGPRYYYKELSSAFERCLRDDVMRVLEQDFDEQIRRGAQTARILDEILSKDPSDLKRIQGGNPVTVEAIQSMFGENGALDRLLNRYRSATKLVIVDLTDPDAQTSDTAKLIGFLEALRLYLFENDKLNAVGAVKLTIDIQLLRTTPDTVWSGTGNRSVYYAPENSLGGIDETARSTATKTLAWNMGAGNKLILRMFWSHRRDQKKPDGDDYFIVVESPLAPLLMAWWWGREEKKDVWHVNALPEKTGLTAPMKFTFPPREGVPFPTRPKLR